MRSVTRVIIVSLTLIGCVGCDQASKSMARSYLVPGVPESLLHDVIRLQLAENAGAFLSVGATLSDHVRFEVFVVAVAVILVGLLMAALFTRRLGTVRIVALAFLAAGGASNLLDRLTDGGRVTDFFNVGIGPIRTGIFNVADLAIVTGALLFVFGGSRARADRSIIRGD
jgi:signal peptidase II